MDGITLRARGDRVEIRARGLSESAVVYTVERPGERLRPQALTVEGDRIRARFPEGTTVEDRYRLEAPGHLRIRRRVRLAGAGRVALCLGWTIRLRARFHAVPAVMVQGNPTGTGAFPRGGPERGWSFREDRIPVPGMSFASDGERWCACFASPPIRPREIGSVRTHQRDPDLLFEHRIPHREGPRSHTRKGYVGASLAAPHTAWLAATPGQELARDHHLLWGRGDRHALDAALARAWAALPAPALPPVDWTAFAARKERHLRRCFLVRRPDATGFVTSVTRGPVPAGNFLSGGFVGKNLEIARSLYRLGTAWGRADVVRDALDVARFFEGARLPNGLLYGTYSLFRRRWYGSFFRRGALSTRMMGEMAEQYLALYREARLHGQARHAWRELVLALARFWREAQAPGGSLGKWWSPAGDRLEDTGTASAYAVPVLAPLASLTGERSGLDAACRVGEHLVRNHVEPMLYAGDALDSDCIDREGGYSVLRALLALYEATGDRAWLQPARRAATWLLSWTFAWDVPFSERSPLGRRRFHTRGGTAVSVAHHHLDPYGLAIAVPLHALARATGETRWAACARDMTAYAGQLVATPEDPLGRSPLWEGFQPEQVNQTRWDYVHPRLFGRGTWKNAIAWVPALTLGAVLDLHAAFPDELELGDPPPRPPDPPGLRRARRRFHLLTRLDPIS